MLDLLAVEAEVVDKPGAAPLQEEASGQCSVRFENVHFAYEPRKPVLKGISFEVPAGHTVAIVGQTGRWGSDCRQGLRTVCSGKSTIMRLLYRFYDIQEGAVYVNGQDVSGVQIQSLRSIMGVVPQDTVYMEHVCSLIAIRCCFMTVLSTTFGMEKWTLLKKK